MSHFSFYPFHLYHPYLGAQFQQNLLSFCLFSQPTQLLQPFSYSPVQNQNLFIAPDSRQNYIQQQHLNLCSPLTLLNQNLFISPEDENFAGQLPTIKNQQDQKKDQMTLRDEKKEGKSTIQIKKERNPKKRKSKKLSKKELKERQTLRNSVQNSKRNIIPNEIHQILSILFKRKTSAHLVSKLLITYSSSGEQDPFSLQRFYLYQSLLKEKISHYANQDSLRFLLCPLDLNCSVYSMKEQSLYRRIGLTLVFHFLRKESHLLILNSQRIKSSNRLQHLKARRYLQNYLKELVTKSIEDKEAFIGRQQ